LAVCPHQDAGALEQRAANPYYDEKLGGWVLSRYADVLAAFRCPELVMVGRTSKERFPSVDEAARLRMRADTSNALTPGKLRSWRKQLLEHARERAAHFDCEHPIDLLTGYAQPLCLELALVATEPHPVSTKHLTRFAAQVSLAAAEPLDETLKLQSKAASAALRPFFTKGPEPMRESGFVALSQTLVKVLGNLWYALANSPQEWRRLHAQPSLLPRGVEELQRFAGLTRLLFRRAIADTTVHGLTIRKGERVVLCLPAANRDPDRYPSPHELSVMRPRVDHLSLGAGLHACVGAPLVRLATVATTLALVERFSSVQLVPPIEWGGGSGFVFPVALPVLLA
jgi:hypothetical protein